MAGVSNDAEAVIEILTVLIGLSLFVLWLRDEIRRARSRRYSKIQTTGLVIAYFWGTAFIGAGVLGLSNHLEQKQALVTDYVFDVVFMIYGMFTWVATRFRYGGGLWSIVGAFLVGGAFVGTVSIIETHMRGRYYVSPITFYCRIASCWMIGGALLLVGHWRHCKKQMPPNSDPEPKPGTL